MLGCVFYFFSLTPSLTCTSTHRVVLLPVCVGSPAGCLEPNTERMERTGRNEGAVARDWSLLWSDWLQTKDSSLILPFLLCFALYFCSESLLISVLFPTLSLRHEPTWTQTSSDPCSGLEGIEHTHTHKHRKCTDSDRRLPARRMNAMFWKSWRVM